MKYPAPLDGSSHSVYSNPQIAEGISEAIRIYTPAKMARHLWSEEMAEFTRTAVTDFGPPNRPEASAYMRALAHLVIHTVKVKCLPLERRIVFSGQNIDGFYAEVLATKQSGPVIRLRLLRLAAELHVFDPERRDAGAKRTSKTHAPYTASQMIRLLSQGMTRSSPKRRHNWRMFVTLGAGCGLTAEEAVALTIDDIVVHPDHIAVEVGGKRPRQVICTAQWESELRELLSSALIVDYLIITTNRPKLPGSWASHYIWEASSWDSSFSMERLRSTFIVSHLEAGTSPIHLLRMLGVIQFSTIERLIPYANVAPIEDCAALLRIPRERS